MKLYIRVLSTVILLFTTLLSLSSKKAILADSLLIVHLLLHQISTMAESSSIQEISARSTLLAIKPNQNLLIDLTPFLYDTYMYHVVECPKYSPLIKALSIVEVIPIACLSQLYATATYDKGADKIFFDILN